LWRDWYHTRRAAKLLLCTLAWTPSRLAWGEPCLFAGASATFPDVMIPVHLLICFCRYFRWLTFLLDFTGLSRASLMLLEAESMKLNRSLVKKTFKPKSLMSNIPQNPRLLQKSNLFLNYFYYYSKLIITVSSLNHQTEKLTCHVIAAHFGCETSRRESERNFLSVRKSLCPNRCHCWETLPNCLLASGNICPGLTTIMGCL
uniref:Uncharacterized protein n=1 Tax=Mola mola TaxID=94237 RepID=A0A3Q3VW58_MOLML